MSSDHDSMNRGGSSPAPKKAKGFSNQFGLAMELPFILVSAICLGGFLGYLLDKWLHTRFIFMFILGALGFFAGIRDILRRLPADADGKS